MSGATTGGEQRRQASITEPACPNNGFIKPSQLLHSTAPGSFRPPQMPLYYTPAQYDWQDPIGRQIPPGYPLSPLYQSHERQMPATHGMTSSPESSLSKQESSGNELTPK